MNNLYIIIIETILVFIAVFLFNYIFFVRKNKKLKKDEMPLELIYISLSESVTIAKHFVLYFLQYFTISFTKNGGIE